MHVEVRGTRLWFDVDGPGLVPDGAAMRGRPTVVLLHGGPGSFDHSYFKPDFARLAQVAQVIYLDLRDHGAPRGATRQAGASSWPPTTWPASTARRWCAWASRTPSPRCRRPPGGLARLEVVQGAGHFTWKDAPGRYWPLLAEFVTHLPRLGISRLAIAPIKTNNWTDSHRAT